MSSHRSISPTLMDLHDIQQPAQASVAAIPGAICSATVGRAVVPPPPPTNEELAAAPIGTKHHRIWCCVSHEEDRKRYAPPGMLGLARLGHGVGDAAFEHALVPHFRVRVPLPNK